MPNISECAKHGRYPPGARAPFCPKCIDEHKEETLDIGMVDRVVRKRGWRVEKDDGKVIEREQYQEHPIPEEYMAALEPHIGDAGAKITVGAELGHNKDYNGAKSFVGVSATCNNNEEDFIAVHNIIHALARKLVNEDLEKMKADRDEHAGVSAKPGKVTTPPRAQAKLPKAVVGRAAAPAKPAPGPAKAHNFPPKADTKPGVPRPSFRR